MFRLAQSVWRALPAALLAAPLLAVGPPCVAADETDDALGGFDDDVLGGFEDDGLAPEPSESRSFDESFWDLTGSLSLGSSVNFRKHSAVAGPDKETDWGGLSRLRTRLNLQLDVDLPWEWKGRLAGFGFYDWAYLANGRNNYTNEVLDQYEWEVDFQEVWIQGSAYEDLDLKLGRQIVNWGRSDNLRVLDVLNPIDNREPGLVDIEDLRRPVTMAKADYYLGDWSLSFIAIPEMRFNLSPEVGNDFAPVLSSLGTVGFFLLPERRPGESMSNTEWAGAIKGIFTGWDISFHAARFWRDTPYVNPLLTVDPMAPIPISFDGSVLKHSRQTLVGAGANYTVGSWLFKAEIAWIDGVDYTVSTPVDLEPFGGPGVVDLPIDTVEKSRLDFMGGVEFYGFSDTNIAIEVVNRHIFGFRNDMRPLFGTQENQLETAIRVSRTLMNERLELTAVGIVFGNHAQDGSIVRLEGSYDIRDALVFNAGIVFYQRGDVVPFDSITKNDRLFFELKYSF